MRPAKSTVWPCGKALGLLLVFVSMHAWGDGAFVVPAFVWNRAKDITEPSQKAIILHDAGREDLILQVKYHGRVGDFGWLIPVPAQPTVSKASMESFYELSRYVQEKCRPADYRDGTLGGGSTAALPEATDPVRVLEYKTVGVYQIAVLAPSDAGALQHWLTEHDFTCPASGDDVLASYIAKHWFFVAVRVHLDDPDGATPWLRSNDGATADPPVVARALANGELHPLKISFDTPTCIYPLKISSLNRHPSEVHLYILATEPMTHTAFTHPVFLKYVDTHATQFPEELLVVFPAGVVQGNSLPWCCKDLPRLANRTWSLVKHERVFAPEEMQDLAFRSLIPLLAADLNGPFSRFARHRLAPFLPTVGPQQEQPSLTVTAERSRPDSAPPRTERRHP